LLLRMSETEPGAVSAAYFEARLAALGQQRGDPEAGFFGPGSMMWAVGREATSFAGAGAAILLQTAHPWIAQAIADHSTALTDPLGRFHRTFRPVFAMIYGTHAQALAQARSVRAVHDRIRGTLPETLGRFAAGSPYRAHDGPALFWVYATLMHVSIAVRERIVGPLSAADKDRYHEETKIFAGLFGVPERLLAANWTAFEARFDEIANSDTLAIGPAGRMIAEHLLGRHKGLGPMVPNWYRAITASLLPRRLAEAYGLKAGPDIETTWRRIAALYRVLPPGLRYIGPYQEACRRLEGRPAGPWVRALNRAWIGRPLIEPAA
jgi:uncharacterized protein (DUF2236 family)